MRDINATNVEQMIAEYTAGAGFASSCARNFWMRLTKMNNTHATIAKLIRMVRKLPHASTAPCFFASSVSCFSMSARRAAKSATTLPASGE